MIGEQNKRILNIILLMIKLTLFIIIPLIQNLVTEDAEEASIEIREGYINRDEAVKLVHKYDHEFQKDILKNFDYIKISENEFYEKLDEFRPSHLWDKVGNDPTHCKNWRLKVKVE